MIKVTATSSSRAVADLLLRAIEDHGYAAACAMGGDAVNQTIKAVALMRRETGRAWAAFPDAQETFDAQGRPLFAIRIAVYEIVAPSAVEPCA